MAHISYLDLLNYRRPCHRTLPEQTNPRHGVARMEEGVMSGTDPCNSCQHPLRLISIISDTLKILTVR